MKPITLVFHGTDYTETVSVYKLTERLTVEFSEFDILFRRFNGPLPKSEVIEVSPGKNEYTAYQFELEHNVKVMDLTQMSTAKFIDYILGGNES